MVVFGIKAAIFPLVAKEGMPEVARKLYDDLDPRRDQAVQHYLGIGVEWWINSSSY